MSPWAECSIGSALPQNAPQNARGCALMTPEMSWQMSRHDMTYLFVPRFLGKCRDMSSTLLRPKSRQMSKRLSRHLRKAQAAPRPSLDIARPRERGMLSVIRSRVRYSCRMFDTPAPHQTVTETSHGDDDQFFLARAVDDAVASLSLSFVVGYFPRRRSGFVFSPRTRSDPIFFFSDPRVAGRGTERGSGSGGGDL